MRSVNQFENVLRLEGYGQVKKLFFLLHFEADNAVNTESTSVLSRASGFGW
jgi:hypothetical protein